MTRESIAHFYSICSVLRVDLTLSSELLQMLKSSIQSYREKDFAILKKKPKKMNTHQSKKTWKNISSSKSICTIAEIQKEELSKRQL